MDRLLDHILDVFFKVLLCCFCVDLAAQPVDRCDLLLVEVHLLDFFSELQPFDFLRVEVDEDELVVLAAAQVLEAPDY